MSTISVSLPADGSTASVSQYNTPITTIVNAINGGLDNSNIGTGAAIAASKISGLNPTNFSNPYKFSCYVSVNQTVSSSTWSLVAFDTKNFDTGSNFNTTTHMFTASIDGFYQFNATLPAISVPSADAYQLALNVGTFSTTPTLVGFTNYIGGTGNPISSMSTLLQLSASQTVQVYAYTSSTTLGGGINFSSFSGFLVSAT